MNTPSNRSPRKISDVRNQIKVRLQRCISLILIVGLVSVSTPAAPGLTVAALSELRVAGGSMLEVQRWFGFLFLTYKALTTSTSVPVQETQAFRDSEVFEIKAELPEVVDVGTFVRLEALPLDQNGVPVSGVRLDWEISTPSGLTIPGSTGIFVFQEAGQHQLIVQGAGKQQSYSILAAPPASMIRSGDQKKEPETPENLLLPFEDWNPENIEHARNVSNRRGETPGVPKRNSNFGIAAPVLAIPGRAGLDLNLNLTYNSRIWTKMGQDMSYDMDNDFPAPGWSIGFGRVTHFLTDPNPSNRTIVLTEADGTKRFFAGSVKNESNRRIFEGQTTDGSFIKALTVQHGGVFSGQECFSNNTYTYLTYPDGTRVSYHAYYPTNMPNPACAPAGTVVHMVPWEIRDKRKNYVSVMYDSNPQDGKFINYIKDTLGRVYTFNYTLIGSRNYLTSISGPGLRDQNGTVVQRTFVRIGYKDHTLAYNFGSLNTRVRGNSNTVKVISSIFYPSTNTGYWFGDTDSYSPYGMVRKIEEQKGMTFDVPTGVISAGSVSRRRTYAYPEHTTVALSDAPEYQTVSETWDGMLDPGSPATTTYQIDWVSPIRTTTVISPHQEGKTIEYSHNSPGSPLDGLTFKTEFYDGNDVLLSRDEVDWGTASLSFSAHGGAATYGFNAVRPNSITHTIFANGVALTKKTINDTFDNYNRVTQMREIGYGNELLRKTTTQYTDLNDSLSSISDWENLPRVINLPRFVNVFDGSDNRIDHTEFKYDMAPVYHVSRIVGVLQNAYRCTTNPGLCPDSFSANLGNLSNVVKYAKVTNSTLETPLLDGRIYDSVGNISFYKPATNSMNFSLQTFTVNTAYSYPETMTQGSNGYPGSWLSSGIVHDYNTSSVLSATDANQKTTLFEYDLHSWRLRKTTSPTGAYSTNDFDDSGRSYSSTAYASGGQKASRRSSKLNGLGLPYREESLSGTDSLGAEIHSVVETVYDNLGRVKKVSNPFRSNESSSGVHWSEVFYDAAGRVEKTRAPDGGEKFNFYNDTSRPQGASNGLGQSLRVRDPIGREKWHRTDADGNVVEVVEPDPNGDGSVATGGFLTKYNYDLLGQLLRTEQGVQERRFRYDSVGRLTHQKMAETRATLDDNGVFVDEASGSWSDYFVYNEMSNISSSTDARGVTTNYSYVNPSTGQHDPLDRIFSVTYATNGATDVLPSPTVKFTYKPSGNVALFTSIFTENASGGRIATYDFLYDEFGRSSEKKTTLAARSDFPMKTNYSYDSLNRLADITYPAQHGVTNNPTTEPRKTIHQDFDLAGRLNGVKVGSEDYASNFSFNSFDHVTSVKIGPSGANQITENYNYNAQTGLLENQKVLKGGNSLLDLSYSYQQCSCTTGGSQQITGIVNNLDRNKDKVYEYDKLGRLKKVTGGANRTWSQSYSYDRYGNRESVASLGFETLRPVEPVGGDGKAEPSKVAKESVVPGYTKTSGQVLDNVRKVVKRADAEGGSDEPLVEQGETAARKNQSGPEKGNVVAPVIPGKSESVQSDDQSFSTGSGTPYDFDGDGKADYSTWRRSGMTPAAGTWVINNSQTGQNGSSQLGQGGNQIAPGDYDGDGKTDKAVWNPSNGLWTIQYSSNGSSVTQTWGLKGDAIVPADYDGDGKTDVAVWRPSTGIWYVSRSSDGAPLIVMFGGQQWGDIPMVGDYDGDGRADITVWRPTGGDWYIYIIQSTTSQVQLLHWGQAGDVPVSADFDGDDATDLAVWRPATGTWYVIKSSNGQLLYGYLGSQASNDVPVPADYDGDGKADMAAWTPSTGTWTVKRSSTEAINTFQLGAASDVAVPSAYIRRSSAPAGQSVEIPRDGHQSLSYEAASNRISTPGFVYDLAGNQTRTVKPDGSALRFQYDAAGRLVKVKDDNQQTMVTHTYGVGRERLVTQEGDENSTDLTYYAWEGGSVIAEYAGAAGNALLWTKNYIFMGGALLATQEKTAGGESVSFHHPDQLGTRVVSDPSAGTSFEQTTLPFGTALASESTGEVNQRFTSYDRSASTGLDYATNRFYDSAQGRFMTVDPIKMGATRVLDPQSLNLYAYTQNDPVNRTDPSGLDWGFPTIGHSTTGMGPTFPGSGTGFSIPSGLSQFLTGLLGNLFSGGRDYAGSFGTPTYFWQLNTSQITPSVPQPLPGAGTFQQVLGDHKSPSVYIQHPDRGRPKIPSWHDIARSFLRKSPACETFIGNLLGQLQKDTGITLEGSIYYFIGQMEKTGRLDTGPAGRGKNGGFMTSSGLAYSKPYGTKGWGFALSYQNFGGTASQMEDNNAVTYLGELIHAIGTRLGHDGFTDKNAAIALNRLGIAVTLDEYDRLPANASAPRYTNGQIVYGASRLWHSIMEYSCGVSSRKPPGMR